MIRLVLAVAVLALSGRFAGAGPSVVVVFEGSTPCEGPIRAILQIPPAAKADLIEWELTLEQPSSTADTGTYRLRYAYGATQAGQPGLGAHTAHVERRGSWSLATAAQTSSRAKTYKLSGGLSLWKLSDNILHVLHADGRLMVGNGGWSYTLIRSDASEPRVDPALIAADGGDEPRTISPVSKGPNVSGVFEGRTPCHGIARELAAAVRPGCWKLKWRVTLLRDPRSYEPTTYKVEGTLYGSHAREGQWLTTRGTADDPKAMVYELLPRSQHRRILLLKGDDNVLFLLDQSRRPLIGTAQNTYTLDRRLSAFSAHPPPLAPAPLASTEGWLTQNLNKTGVRLWTDHCREV